MKEKPSEWIRLLIKYKGICKECKREIPSGEYALWSRSSKAVKHMKCAIGRESKLLSNSIFSSTVQTIQVPCFICGRSTACEEQQPFEAHLERTSLSQICICDSCMTDPDAYENYQQQFAKKLQGIRRLKSKLSSSNSLKHVK
jgi:hypothetical protein